MSSWQHSRRTFLRGIGATALGVPLLRMLERSAIGAPADKPLKLLLFSTPHGMAEYYWAPRNVNSPTDFSLTFDNSILQPIADANLVNRVNILHGIDFKAAEPCVPCDGHRFLATQFTGSAINGNALPNSPSLAEYLYKQLPTTSQGAPLNIGVGFTGTGIYYTNTFSTGGAAISSITDPRETFRVYFSKLVTGGDPAAAAAAQRQFDRRKNVLDLVTTDIKRLTPRLAPIERQKLDLHLSSIDDLQKRLASVPSAACQKPTQPVTTDQEFQNSWDYNYHNDAFLPKYLQWQMDMMAQALACDLSRFGNLSMLYAGIKHPMPYTAPAITENPHEDLGHLYVDPLDNPSKATAPINVKYALVLRYFTDQFVYLMQKLNDFQLLDDTLVVWASEHGHPERHDFKNVPFVLAGGSHGAFTFGRYLVYKGNQTDSPGVAHNKVLVSVLRACGIPDATTFGDTGSQYTGPLPNL